MNAKSISIQVKDERLIKEIYKYKKLVKGLGISLHTIEGFAVLEALKKVYNERNVK